jgi:hypothetical protein
MADIRQQTKKGSFDDGGYDIYLKVKSVLLQWVERRYDHGCRDQSPQPSPSLRMVLYRSLRGADAGKSSIHQGSHAESLPTQWSAGDVLMQKAHAPYQHGSCKNTEHNAGYSLGVRLLECSEATITSGCTIVHGSGQAGSIAAGWTVTQLCRGRKLPNDPS